MEMETVGQIIKKQQAGVNLHKSSLTVLQTEAEGCYSLTSYRGEITPQCVAKNVARIKAAFPALAPEFYKVMAERLIEKGFSDERLTDAVNHVIDTCQYPTPTLANFLSFDLRVKIIDYNQLCGQVLRQEVSWSDFAKIKINDRLYYVRKSDKDLYNIPDEI